ncbi:hypothetical protein EYR36_002343 [Pleurotus pulmonarius]|nr:hypothetical protein EYR36_002343 [Pleurotus pulmonarius]
MSTPVHEPQDEFAYEDFQLIQHPLPPAPQTNVSLMAMVESLGIAPLPWHAPLDFIDVLPTDNIRRRAVENILATHVPDISEWCVHQMRSNDEATYAISMIAVHSLLHSLENSNKFERHTCPSAAVPNLSVQLPTGPHETVTSLFDWPSRVLHHALSNFHKELDELQQSKRNAIRPPQLPTENSASTLFTIFDTYKSKSQYAKICSNMAVAAMGLRYAMEGSELPISWHHPGAESLGLKPTHNAGPRVLMLALHQAVLVSPLVLLMKKDLISKYASRHWHLLIWRFLGSERPAELLQYEDAIWDTVYNIAKNPSDITSLMHSLFTKFTIMVQYNPQNKKNSYPMISHETTTFFAKIQPILRIPTPGTQSMRASKSRPPDRTQQTPVPPTSLPHDQSAGNGQQTGKGKGRALEIEQAPQVDPRHKMGPPPQSPTAAGLDTAEDETGGDESMRDLTGGPETAEASGSDGPPPPQSPMARGPETAEDETRGDESMRDLTGGPETAEASGSGGPPPAQSSITVGPETAEDERDGDEPMRDLTGGPQTAEASRSGGPPPQSPIAAGLDTAEDERDGDEPMRDVIGGPQTAEASGSGGPPPAQSSITAGPETAEDERDGDEPMRDLTGGPQTAEASRSGGPPPQSPIAAGLDTAEDERDGDEPMRDVIGGPQTAEASGSGGPPPAQSSITAGPETAEDERDGDEPMRDLTGGPETAEASGSGGPPPQSPNVGGTQTANEDDQSDDSPRTDKPSDKADETMGRSVIADEASRDHTMADQNSESDLSDIPEDARSSDSDKDADYQTPSAPLKSKRPRFDSTSHSPKRIRFSTKDSESKSGHKSKAKASSTPSRKSSRTHSSTAAPFTPRTVQIADPNSTITVLTPGARLNTTAPTTKPTTTPTLPRIATPATLSSQQTVRKPDLVGTSQDKFKEHLNSILALTTGIRRAYQDKPPPYTSGQPGKIITPVSYDEYQQWAASGRLGEELNTRVILVTGVPLPRHQTFADAVKDLSTRLTAPLTCHDLSIKMGPLGDERHRETSLSQLINISQLPNVKSVNFLDIPGPLPAEIPLVHDDTLDRACFPLTWDTHQSRDSVDMAALQWTIAATPWTWHHLHIDTNGFGTLAMSTYGRKLWAVFRRKDDPCGTRPVCWQHLPKLYDDTVLNSDEYDVDYAILEPGAALPVDIPHRFSSQFADIKTTEGAKDILVVCVVARLLQPLFYDHASDPNYIASVSNSAHEVIQEIQGSHSHKFESPSGEEIDFYTDIYQPYLRHATKMMSKISEAKGFEEKLSHPLRDIELDDPDLDLEVEYIVPFTLMACCPARPPHPHHFIENPRLPDHRYITSGLPNPTLIREDPDREIFYAILYKPFGFVASLSRDHLPDTVTLDATARDETSLRHPRALSDDNIYYAFYPTNPRMGALFDPVNLTIHQIDSEICPIEGGPFMLSRALIQNWMCLERFLKSVGDTLLRRYCHDHPHMIHHIELFKIRDIVEPMILGTRERIHSQVQSILTSFRILSAFVSFTFALWYNPNKDEPFGEAHSILRFHMLKYNYSKVYLLHTSVILNFSRSLRPGGFVNPFTTRWGCILHKFARLGVPIWLAWGRHPRHSPTATTLHSRFCPPQIVLARARHRAIHDQTENASLTTLLNSFDTTAYNSPNPVSTRMLPSLPFPQDSSLSYWDERPSDVCAIPSIPRNHVPKAWTHHCQHHSRYENLVYQDTRSDDATVDHVRQLGMRAMQYGFGEEMSLYMWENEGERVWIVPYGVPQVWDLCKSRVYWPFAKEWDVTAFQDHIPQGAVPGLDSVNDPLYQQGPVRLPPPATTTPYAIPLSTFQLRNNPVPTLAEYLQRRHGYSCHIPGTNNEWYAPNPLPPNSGKPVRYLLYRENRNLVTVEHAAAAVDWYNVLSNDSICRSHLSARWDISHLSPCFISPADFWYTLASDPQGSTVYLFHSHFSELKLVITSATAVLMIFRNSHWDTLRKVILGLLDLGVPFSIAIPRLNGAPSLVRPIHTPTRSPLYNHDTDQDSEGLYEAHLAVSKEILQTPLGRAARERGGILGRLAKDIVSDEDVLRGPIFATQLVAFDGSTYYYADPMPDAIVEVIIGAFRADDSVYSYWPPPSVWDSSYLAGDQWLPDAETWFNGCKAFTPKAISAWQTTLKPSEESKFVLRASERLATAFIANHMATLATPLE